MIVPKIDEYVKQNSIKPSDCIYHTNRSTRDSKGGFTGKIRVLVPKADSIARCEYVCPECKHAAYAEQEWKRPFSIKCEKCGYRISVPKMKQEFKKEMKKE